MVSESVQNHVKVLKVPVCGWREQVIYVHVCIAEGQVSEYLINESLERLSCIPQSKWHSQEFEKTKRSDNSCFRNVCFLNWYLVVCSYQIKFAVNVGTMQCSCKVLNVW